jgi:hypothetical protein
LLRYDLTDTFDVLVGKAPSSQRFTLHSNVFIARSGFFKAARKPEWLNDPTKPVDLQNEEPEVFSTYLNYVYFGVGALQINADEPQDDRGAEEYEDLGPDAFLCSEAEHAARYKEEFGSRRMYSRYLDQGHRIFADLYLLADRLRDLETCNSVIDELIRFSDKGGRTFNGDVIRRVYDATAHGNPLRKMVRDECVYQVYSSDYMDSHVEPGHPEFSRDVMVEFLRLRDSNLNENVGDVYKLHVGHRKYTDKCHYHQHDETHPRCVPEHEE